MTLKEIDTIIAIAATLYMMAGFGVLYLWLDHDKRPLPSLINVDWLAVFGCFVFWPIALISLGIYKLTERP